MTLARRSIDVTFTLGKGTFGESGADTVTLTGKRCTANIQKTAAFSQIELRVYGIALDVMQSLTILGTFIGDQRQNTVTVIADGAVCFAGSITECWIDPSNAPEVSLVTTAHTGALDAVKSVPPTSFRGYVTAATMLSNIVHQMTPPRELQNNGVTAGLTNPYYPGTYMDQIQAIARACNFEFHVEDGAILAIWPKGGSRNGTVPRIAADSGLVGYPMHTQFGVALKTLYDPAIAYGGQIDIETQISGRDNLNGRWVIFTLDHELESETPGGAWFTHIECKVGSRPA